ncbi:MULTISPECIES: DUF6443 domain-containing protein [unclassified Chryseobacterium]|uniref:DUF6443 domain-containing protein n=1 Tax=unclassified Chryseobacterium TaxID=2593645 RepID=UPI00300F9A1A
MKKIIIPISALFITGLAHAQLSPTENYVYSKTYLSDPTLSTPKTSETVQYFDGLGRPKQVVNVKASPLGKDMVTHIEYDGFGRQVKDFLPIPQSGTLNGAIVPTPLANAPSVYGSEKIYAEKVLENSPLDRILEQKQVGNDWSNKPVKFGYDTNAEYEVYKFTTNTTWTNNATLSTLVFDFFPPNQLYKTTVTDEDGNITKEYKNGKGQVIMVRKFDGTYYTDTYYVYNEYDQLAFVIPPKAIHLSITDTLLNDLCYQYRYDGRGRLVEKKLPGKGWEYQIYDKQDRIVAIQDSNLRVNGQWHYTKYDQFGRVAITGIGTGSSRIVEQNMVDGLGSNNVNRLSSPLFNRQGMDVYYGNQDSTYPNSTKWVTVLSLNYYDTYPNYSFNPTFPSSIMGKAILTDNPVNTGKSTNDLPVVILVKNIEDDNWTKDYNYYDTEARLIGTYSINHLGGYTKTESELDFAGTPNQTKTYHKRLNTDTEKVITETFEYDHQNRLLIHKHQVDNNPVEILAQNEYNEFSQLKNKKVGNNLQSIDYTYNIRGWLTKINNPASLGNKLFGYEIKYNNPVNTSLSSAKYNGNITEVDWQSSNDQVLKRYSYQYDGLDRLKKGIYTEPDTSIPENNYYNETLSYDLNGNITSLQRNRKAEYIGVQLMDNLSYSYIGNRLNSVTDLSSNYFGYPDTSGNTMTYDENGNMKDHIDKGFLEIKYNYLNLPNYIKFAKYISRRGQIYYVNTNYIYSADGIKLRKRYNYFTGSTNVGTVALNDYLDGFQYTNTDSLVQSDGSFTMALQFVPTAEGYYDFVKNKYFYQYKDQVGNIRLAFYKDAAGNPTIDRTTDFYPFGLELGGGGLNIYNSQSPNYTYTFQGQEKQEDSGWSSFKWRNYDPTMGRFFNIDPLAEKFPHNSTYAFQENMIGKGIELEGLELLPNNSGYFAIRGNEMVVKQAPASQRDSFGRPSFTAADIGLTTRGYNPTAPRISTGETGLKLKSYNYSGSKAEDLSMESAETKSMAEQEIETEKPNKLAMAKEKLTTVADGVKELMNNAFIAMDIPAAIKSVDDHVKAAKDIKSVEFNATQMDLAIDYVNSSKIKMNQQTKNDVTNYVYDGQLPGKGLMQNSAIIQTGNAILKANKAPIRPTQDQIRKMLNEKQKQTQNNLRNIPR